MPSMDLGDLKNIYIETAREYTEKLSKAGNALSINPADKEAIEDMYIASHSLKGQSMAAGYTSIADACSLIETLSRSVKDGKGKFTDSFINGLDEVTAVLRESINMIESQNSEKDLSAVVKKLQVFV